MALQPMKPHLQGVAYLTFFLVTLVSNAIYTSAQNDPGSHLFLTPLIKAGEIEKAREEALVHGFDPVISYSGYITVNEEYNSNLYFWYFPSEESYGESFYDNDIPVILWSEGGPGVASLPMIFSMGPFKGNEAGDNYTLNPFSWHKKYHMIFMDNPVDVGFSFTENENGYVSTAAEAAQGIYDFLTQFFTMFPHLQNNKFYHSGVSYGGTYSVETATIIHQKNAENPPVRINLQGMIGDSPYFDGLTQIIFGDVLFSYGLISRNTRDAYRNKESTVLDLITQEKFAEAFPIWWEVTQKDTPSFTGYPAMYNVLQDIIYPNMTQFITSNSTRKMLHIGPQEFHASTSENIANLMRPNMLRSVKSKLETLLDAGYGFLTYVGNMDVITGPVGIQRLCRNLTWEHALELVDGPRHIWKDDKGVAGYVTNGGNTSSFVVFRNAGHGVVDTEGERVFKMIVEFVEEGNLRKLV